MSPTHFHHVLRTLALALASINLVSWFTLDTREWLVYFDPWFCRTVLFQTFVVGLPALPFLIPLQNNASLLTGSFLLGVVSALLALFEFLWLAMIAFATFCRGPHWNFYWPWEDRSVLKIVALNRFDLSEWFWIAVLGQSRPTQSLLREWPGLTLLAIHCLVVPGILSLMLRQKLAIAWWRIFLFAFITQLLLLMSLKIALQNLFSLKYLIAFPEWGLNV